MIAPYRCIQLHEKEDDIPDYLTPVNNKIKTPSDYDHAETEFDMAEVVMVAQALSRVGSVVTLRSGLSIHVLVHIHELYKVVDDMRVNQFKYDLLRIAQ